MTLVDVRGIRIAAFPAHKTRTAGLSTHTQTPFSAIGAILVAQRTDDLMVGVRQAKGALGARGGGGGAGRHARC